MLIWLSWFNDVNSCTCLTIAQARFQYLLDAIMSAILASVRDWGVAEQRREPGFPSSGKFGPAILFQAANLIGDMRREHVHAGIEENAVLDRE